MDEILSFELGEYKRFIGCIRQNLWDSLKKIESNKCRKLTFEIMYHIAFAIRFHGFLLLINISLLSLNNKNVFFVQKTTNQNGRSTF